MSTTRRAFLRTTATAGIATVAGADMATAAAPSRMSVLIEAHRQAFAAYNLACKGEEDRDDALDKSLKADPVFYRITEANGRRCCIEAHLGRRNAERSVFAATAVALALDPHNGSHFDPDAFGERVAHAVAREKANLAALDDADREYQARRDALEMTAAEDEREEAEAAADEALDALVSYRPATLAEAEERMAYLVESEAAGPIQLQGDPIRKLFASMTGGRTL